MQRQILTLPVLLLAAVMSLLLVAGPASAEQPPLPVTVVGDSVEYVQGNYLIADDGETRLNYFTPQVEVTGTERSILALGVGRERVERDQSGALSRTFQRVSDRFSTEFPDYSVELPQMHQTMRDREVEDYEAVSVQHNQLSGRNRGTTTLLSIEPNDNQVGKRFALATLVWEGRTDPWEGAEGAPPEGLVTLIVSSRPLELAESAEPAFLNLQLERSDVDALDTGRLENLGSSAMGTWTEGNSPPEFSFTTTGAMQQVPDPASTGISWIIIGLELLGVAVVLYLLWRFWRKRQEEQLAELERDRDVRKIDK